MLAVTQLELAVDRTNLGSKRPSKPSPRRRLSLLHQINIVYLQVDCKVWLYIYRRLLADSSGTEMSYKQMGRSGWNDELERL